MLKKFSFLISLTFLLIGTAFGQSNLAACQGTDPLKWNNCSGVYTFPNGDKYLGEFKDGNFNGTGTYTYSNGEKYIGGWKNGQFEGRGTKYSSLGQYTGEFKESKFHGKGTYIFGNGNTYVGDWRDDKPNGRGILTEADGGKYIGEIKDNMRNGQGTQAYPSGDTYIGEWKDNIFNGQGTYYRADGRLGLGEWIAGKPSGRFIEYRANKTIERSGIFREGNFVTSQYIDSNSFTQIEKYKAKLAEENRKIELERERASQQLAEEKQRREAKAAEEKRIQEAKAAEEKRIQEAKAAEERRIQEAKEAEERRIQEANEAEEKRIQEAKDAKEAEERRIWLTTPAGKKFAAAEAAKAKKEEADRQKAAAIEEARVKKEEAERQKAAAIEQARMEKEELQRQKLALEAQLRENLRVAQEKANFEKEFPYYAVISCTYGSQFFYTLHACLDKTEIELRNGSEYGLYKVVDIMMGKLGREKLPPNGEGLKINLRNSFELSAQAGKGNLILGVVIYRTKDNTIIFQKKASEYRVIHARNN